MPSRLAAPIQIMNTCRAMAEQGARVDVHTGPLQGGDERSCLAFYGLDPHENLRIIPATRGRGGAVDPPGGGAEAGGPGVLVSRGEPGLALARRLRGARRAPPFVMEVHRLCFPEVGAWRRGSWLNLYRLPGAEARVKAAERSALEMAAGLIYLTEGVRAAVEATFRVERPSLILPSGTAPPPDDLPGPGGRDIDVLYAGKIARRKGIYDLLGAMRHLPGRRLWVLGGSPAEVRSLRAEAEAEGVADRVVMEGFVEPARVPSYLRRARVGVCPLPAGVSSISESFTSPLKILELLAHGVPVVATDLPSVREILEDEVTALLVPPGRPEALAGAILRLLEDPASAESLGLRGRARAAEFSWGRRAGRLLGFLRGLAGGGGP